jgi:hypothetical protein
MNDLKGKGGRRTLRLDPALKAAEAEVVDDTAVADEVADGDIGVGWLVG